MAMALNRLSNNTYRRVGRIRDCRRFDNNIHGSDLGIPKWTARGAKIKHPPPLIFNAPPPFGNTKSLSFFYLI